MKLTEAQVKWIKDRNRANRRALQGDPRRGWLAFQMENLFLSILLELNDVE